MGISLGKADPHQVRSHGQAGQRVSGFVIEAALDVLQQAGGDVGRDAVDVDDKGPRLAFKDHILDAGDFQ